MCCVVLCDQRNDSAERVQHEHAMAALSHNIIDVAGDDNDEKDVKAHVKHAAGNADADISRPDAGFLRYSKDVLQRLRAGTLPVVEPEAATRPPQTPSQ